MKKSSPNYSDYVYRIKEDFVNLQPEPNNEHDRNAIAVYMNDVKIGHVPAAQTHQINPLIGKHNFVGVITGGDKRVSSGVIQRDFNCIVRIEK